MAAQGYNGAGMREVAARAGVAVGTVYVHFPGGKREILFTLVNQLASSLAHADIQAAASFPRGLESTIEAAAAFWDAHRDVAQILFAQSMFDKQLSRALQGKVVRPLTAALRKAAANGGYKDPDAAARVAHALIMYCTVTARNLAGAAAPHEIAADVIGLIAGPTGRHRPCRARPRRP